MFYRCDPRKNNHCSKRNCYITPGGTCNLTSDPECSIDGKMLLGDYTGKHITIDQEKAGKEILDGKGIYGK